MARKRTSSTPRKARNEYRADRGARRGRKEPIGEAFRRAKKISAAKANTRAGRRSGMMARAAIADVPSVLDLGFDRLNWWQKCLSYLKALCLVPVILLVAYTLVEPANDANFMYHFWRSEELLFFGVGIFLMLGWFWSRLFSDYFLYFYVLGHELTHALFVYLSLGWVSEIRVSTDGGYIMTNKSNILIALSPYFIPFWSLVVLSISGFMVMWAPLPHGDDILLLLLGGTWCFHVVWTLWMIPRDQPDLQEHGRIFSISIIILANLVILTGMACLTSPDLNVATVAYRLFNNGVDAVQSILHPLLGFRI